MSAENVPFDYFERYRVVSEVVRQRQTWKVLGDIAKPVEFPDGLTAKWDPVVRDAVQLSGWAPFHYARNHDGLAEPWRFHVLYSEDCRKIGQRIPVWFEDVKPSNKLPSMLAACGALVLVNWLPQFDEQLATEKQVLINEEHLAATSAAVQNLLLLLTAAGLGTYWSSGGFFRDPLMAGKLDIDPAEKLIAAVFVDYLPDYAEPAIERIAGKHRSSRDADLNWVREVKILDEPAANSQGDL